MCTCHAAGMITLSVSVISDMVVTRRNFLHLFAACTSCDVSMVVPLVGSIISIMRLSFVAHVCSEGRS